MLRTIPTRYEWLNTLESAQKRIEKDAKDKEAQEKVLKKGKKKKKGKEEEEAEPDRATLWQALLQLEGRTRDTLEGVYNSEKVSCAFCLSSVSITPSSRYQGSIKALLRLCLSRVSTTPSSAFVSIVT